MKDLEKIISVLSKEEIRFYKLFVKRTASKNYNRKDIELFDFIKKGRSDGLSTKDILKKLEITNSNNYYQLKNRIYHDLNNSMTWQHISKNNQSLAFSYILLSRVYKNKGELQLSLNYLIKSEKVAIEKELFEILSIIYTEIIELSHEMISIDIDHYIKLKKHNLNLLREIDQIDMLLAKIMHDIKTKQNFSKSKSSLISLIKDKISETKKNKFLINSPRFKMRLFKMYSRVLLQNEDFFALEIFLIKSWNEFNKYKIFNSENHEDKLTLLTYLTNCLYRNKKYKISLQYANELRNAMKEYDAFLEEKYLFYYYNSLVLNYSITDKDKSLEVLKKASNDDMINKMPAYTAFIYLNTSIIYFQKSKYKLSQKNISRLILQNDFINLDRSFQFRVLILELIIRVELGDFTSVKNKIKDIRLSYKKMVLSNMYTKERDFLEIIEAIANKLEVNDKVNSFLSNHKEINETENISMVSYNEWILKFI